MLKSILIYGVLILTTLSYGQKKELNGKVSPLSIVEKTTGKYAQLLNDIVGSYDNEKLASLYITFQREEIIAREEAEQYALLHNIPMKRFNEDGSFDQLVKISGNGTPIYYTLYNVDAAVSTRTNYLNSGGGLGLELNGNDLTAHVWDGGPVRPTHQEFDGAGGSNRVTINDGATTLDGNSYHAQHVTGTISASGFQPNAKGMAWQANVLTHEWNSDLSEATAEAANGMLVSNHSYGYRADLIDDQLFGAYISESRSWDNLMYNSPYYLMIVAAGNDGNDNTSNGAPLDGQSSYDKLSGHSTSKNNLVVANGQDATIDGSGNLVSVSKSSSSSEGPTDDYRIKPDIMGNGSGLYSTFDGSDSAYNTISGTSMASPNVTGTLLLLQEHYQNVNGSFMRAATLKGLALHTADDVSPVGPDAHHGWGLLNAKKAAETITAAEANGNAEVVEETLSNGGTYQVVVQASGTEPLLASISWTDPAGTATSNTNDNTPVLVNDLDLQLSQGASTYNPWRLTGVTSNGTGDNVVDPFERIDVSSASGVYTLTISHKGSLTSGAQDFSLLITGGSIIETPSIAFLQPTININEDTDCDYVEVTIPVAIGIAPSQNADVTFTVDGGTATNASDYEIVTSSVTFPSGSIANQDFVIRVYKDAWVEGDENVTVSFTVNPNGGDAVADPSGNSLTINIIDDDSVPLSTEMITVFSEDFEQAPYGFTSVANAGSDGFVIGTAASLASSYWDTDGSNATNFAFSNDDNCNCDKANDRYTSDSFSLVGYNTATLTFDHAFSDIGGETAVVEISTGGAWTTLSSLSNTSTDNGGSYYTTPWVNGNTVDLSSYIGNANVQIRFIYSDGGAWAYGIALDNISISATQERQVQTATNNATLAQVPIREVGTLYAFDSASSNIMAAIQNADAFDYGCTTIEVSRAGTTAQSFNGSTAPNLVMDKAFTISPSDVSNETGDTTVSFYMTEAEISGWETASGLNRTELMMLREDVGNGVSEIGSAISLSAFGSHHVLSGNFSGVGGTYYFGPSDAFQACPGVTTFASGSWNNGAGSLSMQVVLNDNFNTSLDGDIEACSLLVRSGNIVIVTADNHVRVNGNITVESGATLIIEHEGSLVQIDDSAIVTNNGTIEVHKTTPFLNARDFMIMGSPMIGETRNGVYNDAIMVRNHITTNFVPNPSVASMFPSAENFADDNGDNWTNYSGTINAGEGYLVRPQNTPTESGSYDLTYTQGTLNNGIVSFSITYNGNSNASPNILGNPYASAIDANAFLAQNSMIDALYFWEHVTAPNPSYPGYNPNNYDMGDISMYNSLGGVPAANGGATPTQYIASGQGFGVKATAAGTAVFNNSMRIVGNNNTYRAPVSQANRLWLNVFNDNHEIGSTMLVGYTEDGTLGYDSQYDSKRLATAVSFYSFSEGGKELAIQGRSTFDEMDEVQLGFSTQIESEEEYRIAVRDVMGDAISATNIWIIDHYTGEVVNISEAGEYIFTSREGTFNDRFTLLYREKSLDVAELSAENAILVPNPSSKYVSIMVPQSTIEEVTIYDVMGRVVLKEKTRGSQHQLDISSLQVATYFVRIDTAMGSVTKQLLKK